MDLNPSMRWALRRIGEVIDTFAAGRGWGRDDYRWFYTVNPDWGFINVILLAGGFEMFLAAPCRPFRLSDFAVSGQVRRDGFEGHPAVVCDGPR